MQFFCNRSITRSLATPSNMLHSGTCILCYLLLGCQVAYGFNPPNSQQAAEYHAESKTEDSSMVELVNSQGKYLCPGVLIKLDVVATTANCVYHPNDLPRTTAQIKVTIANNRKSQIVDSAVKGSVKEIIVHPKFDFDNTNNDIALLRLDEPLDSLHLAVSPLDISEKHLKGTKCRWGKKKTDCAPLKKYYSWIKKYIDS